MARLNSGTISRRTVEGLPMGERETVFWDRALSGFGVRVYPSGSKVYLVQTRAGGKSRRVTIGRHGLLSAEQARRKAAAVIAGIKAGEEPSRNGSVSSSATGPALAGCVKTPTWGHERPIRHSRESGNPGVLEGSLRGVSPLHPAWIPAFAGMTISGVVASFGWSFDTGS